MKLTVCPTLKLMSVANPWIVESPDPLTYHTDFGVPGRQFSDSIAFAGDVQAAPAIPDGSKVKNASSTTDARLTPRMVTDTPAHPVGATKVGVSGGGL